MTVCIAAIASNQIIVTASDLMVSGAISSLDSSTVKLEPFHEHWATMMAAEDLSQCVPIIERAKDYVRGRNNSLQVVRSAFKKAYQQHLSERAADKVLGRFSLEMKDFSKSGKRRFTDAVFTSLCEEIQKVRVGCEFLIYGYDKDKHPHIFTVEEPGIDSVYDKPGFHAIGSGCYAAEGLLFYLGQNIYRPMEETIFNVCAAKFMAEKVSGVGRDTFLFVKRFGSQSFATRQLKLVGAVRDYWEQEGKPRVSPKAIEMLKNADIHFPGLDDSLGS